MALGADNPCYPRSGEIERGRRDSLAPRLVSSAMCAGNQRLHFRTRLVASSRLRLASICGVSKKFGASANSTSRARIHVEQPSQPDRARPSVGSGLPKGAASRSAAQRSRAKCQFLCPLRASANHRPGRTELEPSPRATAPLAPPRSARIPARYCETTSNTICSRIVVSCA